MEATMPAYDRALSELIEREIQLYEMLNEALAAEQAALVHQAIADLERLAVQKLNTLEQIDQCVKQRTDILRTLGCQERGVFMQWLSDKALLLKAWCQLETLCARAQSINRVNGQLIARHLADTQEALDILMASPQSTMAYKRDGGARSAIAGGRTLGQA